MNQRTRRGSSLYPVLAMLAIAVVLVGAMMDRTLEGHRAVVQSEQRAQARAAAEGAAAVLVSGGTIDSPLTIGNCTVAAEETADSEVALTVRVLGKNGVETRTSTFRALFSTHEGTRRLRSLEATP